MQRCNVSMIRCTLFLAEEMVRKKAGRLDLGLRSVYPRWPSSNGSTGKSDHLPGFHACSQECILLTGKN